MLPAHPQADTPLMDVEAFGEFLELRPENERWELLDGELFMSPSPSFPHQLIVSNLIWWLRSFEEEHAPPWVTIPTLGVQIVGPRASALQPDVIVRPNTPMTDWVCTDPIVLFEVLSPSSVDRDLEWKRKNYPRLPDLAHYAVIAQDRCEVILFDRATGFEGKPLRRLDDALPLPALGVEIPLSRVYKGLSVREA